MSFSFRGAIALALTAVACGGSIATPDGGTANDGGSSQDGTTGDGGGKGCGASSECASTQYCDFNGHCQFAALKKGTCKPRPTACPDLSAPTCACDGKVYSSPCDTYGAGLDVDKEGACPAPPRLDLVRAGLLLEGHQLLRQDQQRRDRPERSGEVLHQVREHPGAVPRPDELRVLSPERAVPRREMQL